MPEQDEKMTASKGLEEFVKLLPKTVRAMQPVATVESTRGAGFWFAFAKARGAKQAQEPKR